MFHHNLRPHPCILSLKSELLQSAGVDWALVTPTTRAGSWAHCRGPFGTSVRQKQASAGQAWVEV